VPGQVASVRSMNITIHTVDYHRNGVSGEGFYTAHFTEHSSDHPGGKRDFIATVFPPDPYTEDESEYLRGEPNWDKPHNPRVAVLAVDKLPDVRFIHNSWRGDNFAPALYAAIKERHQPTEPPQPRERDWCDACKDDPAGQRWLCSQRPHPMVTVAVGDDE
jgi:hypothetical protein